MAELTDTDYQIILSLANNRMKPTLVGYELFLHRNTVMYHINKIKSITGLDPLEFYDLYNLVQMVREGGVANVLCQRSTHPR